MKPRAFGFTFIELLVVIAIVAVLASLAVPSFRALMVKRSVQSAASILVSDMRLARSEALRRSTPVTVCSLVANSTSTCTAAAAGTWANGWLVFKDLNGDGVVDAGDEIIRVQQLTANTLTILNPNPASTRAKFTYQATGWAKSADDTLVVTPTGEVPSGAVRCVIVSITGRPSVWASGQGGCP